MRRIFPVALLVIACLSAGELLAQGKGPKGTPPGQAKKKVTPDAAVVVTRDILVKHGFTFVRVERVGGTQVIYYRRGNMGKGKGLGPIEKMVVRPSGDVVVFDNAPSVILVDVKLKLGL